MDYPIGVVDQLRDHLRSLRQLRGLTQTELGRRLGLSQGRVAEIEGNPGLVSTEQLVRVLQALGAELSISDKGAGVPPRGRIKKLTTTTVRRDLGPSAKGDTFRPRLETNDPSVSTGVATTTSRRSADSPVIQGTVTASDAFELSSWAAKLGVSETDLVRAVEKVKSSAPAKLLGIRRNRGSW